LPRLRNLHRNIHWNGTTKKYQFALPTQFHTLPATNCSIIAGKMPRIPFSGHGPWPRLYRWRRRAWNFMIYEWGPISLALFPWSSVSPWLFFAFNQNCCSFFSFIFYCKSKSLPKPLGQKGSGRMINGLFTFPTRNYEHCHCPRPISHTLCLSIRQAESKLIRHQKGYGDFEV